MAWLVGGRIGRGGCTAGEGAPTEEETGPRRAVDRVLRLPADSSVDGNNLLGDGGRSAPANADPTAVRVLTHGDPIPAPSGRADDFSWPRRGDPNAEAAPEPAPVTPPTPPPQPPPANPHKPTHA